MPAPSNEELRRFSHDLRNILSALSMNAQLLELALRGAEKENEAEAAKAIAGSVRAIETLLANEIERRLS
ncbi:MAG TPA: histidine kinase dimerization/phospho-acceptor domain-containing protein [Candidatus Paceibacterota bacterium]|nr:histidine kinase dimerization/phospho-acceptor domain-containing protein [Candidatus Paceibacterota bacterium]